MNPTEFRSLLENKLNKEFLTSDKTNKKSESQPISLARLAGDASLARNNFRVRSFGIFRNKNIFRNIFRLFCSWE